MHLFQPIVRVRDSRSCHGSGVQEGRASEEHSALRPSFQWMSKKDRHVAFSMGTSNSFAGGKVFVDIDCHDVVLGRNDKVYQRAQEV